LTTKRVRRTPHEGRNTIVCAAERLLAETDFSSLTVDAVMKSAGMTRSAFYHYFSGLDDLALGLLERFEQEIRNSLTPWQDPSSWSDAGSATISYLQAMFEVIDRHRTGVNAVAQAASANPVVYEAWQRRVLDYFFEQTALFIRHQVAAGHSRVSDPERTARALTLMNHASLADNFARTDPDTPAQLSATLGAIWNATLYGNVDTHATPQPHAQKELAL